MTKDEIIKLARQVGFPIAHPEWQKAVEEFAALCEEAGRTAEREECAKVCDEKAAHCEKKAQEAIESGEYDEVSAIRSTAWQISVLAADIRARGKP